MGETRESRVATFGVAVVLLAVCGWGVTYVPLLKDTLPSLLTAPEPTVKLDLNGIDGNDTTALVGAIKDGCNGIPFWMRPLAGPPLTVRVVLMDGAHVELGEATYRCRDGKLLRDKRY